MAEAAQRGIAAPVQDQFNTALAALVEQVKRDRSVLAAILCGSLSHDTVWSKSDIDLVLVTIDDKQADRKGISLYAEGINVHANLMTRGDFRKTVEGSLASSFIHSLLAKGRLLYPRRDHRRPLPAPDGTGRTRHPAAASGSGESRPPLLIQGAEMADHTRGPRLRGAMDSLRCQRAGQD